MNPRVVRSVAGAAVLSLAVVGAGLLAIQTATPGHAQAWAGMPSGSETNAVQPLPPIPRPGPLSRRRSLDQIGIPRQLTRDAIPVNAIDDNAKRGWQLFNTRGRCNKCHALSSKVPDPSNFTDNDFHNIGIGIIRHDVAAQARQAKQLIRSGDMAAIDRAAIQTDLSVLGRFLVTKKEADIASFKTPDIRNVLVTAPYFHDGSQQTLWDVVDHYNKGDGLKNPWLDEDIQPLALSERDIDDLVAFMASLTSPDYSDLGRTELARQRALAQVSRPQRDTKRSFGPKPVQPKPPSP